LGVRGQAYGIPRRFWERLKRLNRTDCDKEIVLLVDKVIERLDVSFQHPRIAEREITRCRFMVGKDDKRVLQGFSDALREFASECVRGS